MKWFNKTVEDREGGGESERRIFSILWQIRFYKKVKISIKYVGDGDWVTMDKLGGCEYK